MNTTCKMVTLIMGSDSGNRNVVCDAPTLRGRTHCEDHRQQELTRLAGARVSAKRMLEAADQDYFAYLSEGYDP